MAAQPDPFARRLDDATLAEMHAHYSAGLMSLRAIGAAYGVSESAVRKAAKRHGWRRDSSDTIRSEGRARAQRADAAKTLAAAGQEAPPDALTERQIVDAGATLHAQILASHKDDLDQLKQAARRAREELDAMATGYERLDEVVDRLLGLPEDALDHKSVADLVAACAPPERIKALNTLVQAVDRIQRAERLAYGLDKPDEGAELEEYLARLTEAAKTFRADADA